MLRRLGPQEFLRTEMAKEGVGMNGDGDGRRNTDIGKKRNGVRI